MIRPIHRHRGDVLVEAMVAIGLMATFAATLFVYIGTQLLSSTGAPQELQAIALSREGLEAARAIRDMNWNSLTTGTHGIVFSANNSWTFSGTSDTNSGFTRTVTVSSIATSTNERQVVSRVTWTGTNLLSRSITLSSNLSNWRNVTSTVISGNWQAPLINATSSFTLGAGVYAKGIAYKNGYVYIAATASSSSKNDFFIADVADVSNPTLISSMDIGPGVNGIAVSGTFAFLSSEDSTAQSIIVNISSTSSPYVVNSLNLTGNSSIGKSIAVTGSLMLVGTTQDSGPELYLVDISNPSSPSIKSALEVTGDVNDIVTYNNLAFIATSSSTGKFMSIDISNPNAPAYVTKKIPSGSQPAIALFNNAENTTSTLYVTRTQASGTSPEVVSYRIFYSGGADGGPNKEMSYALPGVFASSNLLFLLSVDPTLEFQVWDVTSGLTAATYYGGLNLPASPTDLVFYNNYFYISLFSSAGLSIVTAS